MYTGTWQTKNDWYRNLYSTNRQCCVYETLIFNGNYCNLSNEQKLIKTMETHYIPFENNGFLHILNLIRQIYIILNCFKNVKSYT